MLELLKTKIITTNDNESFPLALGRVKDEHFQVRDFFFAGVTEAYINHFVVKIKSDIEGGSPYVNQTIRFDNILGDIPVLPGYENIKLVEFGTSIREYQEFQNEVRTYMGNNINKNLALHYQNDDGTISIVHTTVFEVNKSNFLGDDFWESKETNKLDISHFQRSGKKYHRFISENGFLFKADYSSVAPNQQDDGYVFPTPKSELISLLD
jgi:hypothetical protein